MSELAIGCQDPKYRVVSLTEDFCLSPDKPVGYMIHQTLDVSILQTPRVRTRSFYVLNEHSCIASVKGNEAGVGGGLMCGVNLGMCRPSKQLVEKVRAEKGRVICHDTIMEMNCPTPDGPYNTEGAVTADTTSQPSPATTKSDIWDEYGYLSDEEIQRQLKDGSATKKDTVQIEVDGEMQNVDVIEVDPPLHRDGPLGGFSRSSDNYVIIAKNKDPLATGSIQAHELQHWKDHHSGQDIPSHQSEINARNAEIEWRNQNRDKYDNKRIDDMNREDQEEIKAFEQFDKDPSQINKSDLTAHGVYVINGTYCETSGYKSRKEYAEQCKVLDEYDKEFEEEKRKAEAQKQLEENQQRLEELKQKREVLQRYEQKTPGSQTGSIEQNSRQISEVESKIKSLENSLK